MEVNLFCQVTSDKARGNVLKLCQRIFGLDIREKFFAERVAKHCSRLTTVVVQAPYLEEFKRHVDVVPRDILLKGLQQKCHKILPTQSAGSAALKSRTHGRLGLKVTSLARAAEGMLSSAWTSGLCTFFLNYLFFLPVRAGEVFSVLPSALPGELMRVMHSNSSRELFFSATHGLLQ